MIEPRTIDKNSYVPLYVQIMEDLKRLIPECSSKFYSDDELVRMYGVNRLTVRRAVEKLVDEGLLYRVRGVGTFVQSPKIGLPTSSTHFSTFEDECIQAGKVCVVKILERSLVEAPLHVQEQLRLEQVCYLERLRYVDDIPVVIDKFYMPEAVFYQTDDDFCSKAMMPDILYRATGVKPAYSTISAEATLASHGDSEKLRIAAGDPLLMRRMKIFCADDLPAAIGKSLNRGDLSSLNIQLNY